MIVLLILILIWSAVTAGILWLILGVQRDIEEKIDVIEIQTRPKGKA